MLPVLKSELAPELFGIAKMCHRVMLCSMNDVVNKDGEMSLAREGIREIWAYIIDKRGSLAAPSGYVVRESLERTSHLIATRYMYDLDIRSTAWIYERRLKSPPRWFKVLEVIDHRVIYQFSARLVERSDEVTPPVAQSPFVPSPIPDSVNL